MDSDKIKIRWLLLLAVLFLCFIIVFAINSNGEVLRVIKGDIHTCEYLGGGKAGSIPHATIKTEHGHYVTAGVDGCSPGKRVNILVKRGVLYFNTIYVAEKS